MGKDTGWSQRVTAVSHMGFGKLKELHRYEKLWMKSFFNIVAYLAAPDLSFRMWVL